MAGLALLCALGLIAAVPRPAPASTPIAIGVDLGHQRPPVPRSFLGLSFEASVLSRIASFAERGNMVALLRSLGPGVVRFGGVSADSQVAWSDAETPPPAWARTTIGEADLRGVGRLLARSGWRALLTIGLGHFEPAAAAREARAARAAFGPRLQAIELGNEPNSYGAHGLREEPWTPLEYLEEVAVYRQAIAAVAPGLRLAGPDVSGSAAFPTWGLEELLVQSPTLLTGHHYPLGCSQQPPPSVARLLSAPIRGAEAGSLRRYLGVASQTDTPFRLDEANTVSCGGVAGISDTFASALWAVDYIARAMSMGTAGINLEGNPTNCRSYTPVCAADPHALAQGRLTAQPEWYALLLARALLGDRPLGLPRSPAGYSGVDVSEFLAPDGTLHCVLVDDEPPGSQNVVLAVRAGKRFGNGSLLRLRAPSLVATSGVTLGGRAVASDGRWRVPSWLPPVAVRHGTARVVMRPSSAALLTLPPAARH